MSSNTASSRLPSQSDLNEMMVPVAQNLNDAHPLEARVANWDNTQEEIKLKMLQRTQGFAAPMRRIMDAKIIEQSSFIPNITGGSSNISLDILKNKDQLLEWEDVYREDAKVDFHQELQNRMGLN